MKRLVLLLLLIVGIGFAWEGVSRYLPQVKQSISIPQNDNDTQEIVDPKLEENFVISVVKNSEASVVTIGIENPPGVQRAPLDPFNFFFETPQNPDQDERSQERFIK